MMKLLPANIRPWSFATFEMTNGFLAIWVYLFQSRIIECTTRDGFNYVWVTIDYKKSLIYVSNGFLKRLLKRPVDQLGFQKYLATTDALMLKGRDYFPECTKLIRECSLQNRLVSEEEYKKAIILHALAQ